MLVAGALAHLRCRRAQDARDAALMARVQELSEEGRRIERAIERLNREVRLQTGQHPAGGLVAAQDIIEHRIAVDGILRDRGLHG